MIENLSKIDQEGLAGKLKESVKQGEVSAHLAEATRASILPLVTPYGIGLNIFDEITKNPQFTLLASRVTREEVEAVIAFLIYK